MATEIARLVVRAPNWLGDAVMALPALHATRRHFAAAHVTIAARPGIAPLFEEATIAEPDAVLAADPDREAAALAAGRFDAVLLLTNSFGSAWRARRAGIAERWGYATVGRGWLLTRKAARPRQRVHQSAYYLELMRRLGIDTDNAVPSITVTAVTRARAGRLLEQAGFHGAAPLVAFAPGAAYGHAKRWPPDRVAQVASRLAAECGVVPVLLGGAADRATGREIESSLPPGFRIVNLIGRTDLRLLAGVVARCAAMVSNDSGAMHLAAAVGVPVTAIFGPTDERATSPLGPAARDVILHDVFCRPCMLRECPIDHRCMKRITVEEVFQSVEKHMGCTR